MAKCFYELASLQGHASAQYKLAIFHDPEFELKRPNLEKGAKTRA
jgi:hypothetical protein